MLLNQKASLELGSREMIVLILVIIILAVVIMLSFGLFDQILDFWKEFAGKGKSIGLSAT